MTEGLGQITLNDKRYRINLDTYRGRDIIDFAPRASVPTGSVIMSDLSLYQPMDQTDWRHGFGFHWYGDAMGYMRTVGNIDTRHDGMAMMFTQSTSSDTNNATKEGMVVFGGALYSWGSDGVRKYASGSWSAVSITPVTYGTAAESEAASASSLTYSVTVQDSGNRLLLVSVHLKSNTTISSVTYGGVAMTSVQSVGTAPKTALYRLVAPTVGTASVVITLGASDAIVSQAATFYNVHQSSYLGTPGTDSGTSTSDTIVTSSATRRAIIDVITVDAAVTLTATNSNTELGQDSVGTVTGGMGVAAGGASITTGWSWSGSVDYEHIAVEINYIAEPAVRFMLNAGDYLFAFPADGRVLKSTDGATWTTTGANPAASDFLWAVIFNGFIYCGKNNSNRVHYSDTADLSDLEGDTNDPGIIYVGISSIPSIRAITYLGNVYVAKQDGLWQISEDLVARKMLDYSAEMSSNNFRSMAVVNGFLMFSMRDKVIQWNSARVSDITPYKLTDTFPYVTYGTFDNFFQLNNFLFCTGKTNESTYTIALLCWDGVGWHKLSDLVTSATEDVTCTFYDVVNNYLWWHWQKATDATSYIPMQSNSTFPYSDFATSGTHSLILSRWDMGFRRVTKSMTSLIVEAENLSSTRYISVYYQIDGDGTWYLWDTITESGFTELENPGGNKTLEFNFIMFRFDFVTGTAAQSPILLGATARFIMRPDTKFGYTFDVLAGTGYSENMLQDDERTGSDILRELRVLRDSKAPIQMTDVLGDTIWGYISSVQENPITVHDVDQGELMDFEYWITCNFVSM